MKSRKSQPATTRIASSVGAANQPVQPKARAKADLVVSTRTKEFKRTPPNQAGPLERKKAFRILKRLATNPIREDQAPTEGYQKILENIAWAVIPDFDFALTTSKSNKRKRSMEVALEQEGGCRLNPPSQGIFLA